MELYELGKDARLVTEGEAMMIIVERETAILPEGPALNVRREIEEGSYEAHMICEHCGNEYWRGCMADAVTKALEAGPNAIIPVPDCTTPGEFGKRINEARKMVEVARDGLANPQTVESAKLFPTPIQSDEKIAKEADINPKDALGDAKPQVGLVPMVEAVVRVFELGAKKYGPLNWRSKAVRKMVYAHAALRHIFAWIGGQDKDPESGESHLAHAAACLLIVCDADARGKAVEDREWLK